MKVTQIENPENFKINKKPEFQFHRNNIVSWSYIKVLLWGNHVRKYYKISTFEDFTIDKKLKEYFGEEYTQNKKKLNNIFKFLEKEKYWIPIDRLYVKAQIGTINVKTNEIQKKTLDLEKTLDRGDFLRNNCLTQKDFILWVLFAADFEGIKTFNDILDKQQPLITNFIRFCKNDMLPDEFKDKFNALANKLGESNIKPIDDLNMAEFYQFVTHPSVVEISTSMALEKLFYIISESPYLRGLVNNMNPCLKKYTEYLTDIFALKYNNKKNLNLSKFRQLKENEIRVYDENESYIDENFFIPDSIKEKYSFVPEWKKNIKEKGEKMNIDEYRKFKERVKSLNNKSVIEILNQRIEKLEPPEEITKERLSNLARAERAKKEEEKTPDETIIDILSNKKTK